MFIELIASYGPLLIAAAVLVPAIAFLCAMLFKGAFDRRWGTIRRATRKALDTQPLRLPLQRQHSIGGGGLGMRRVSAAPQEHECDPAAGLAPAA